MAEDEEGRGGKRPEQIQRMNGAGREHGKRRRKENDLALTQVDHYLLVHRCDVVEKVKVIVWK